MYPGELWASQVAMLVKNLPAKEIPEMWVQSLGWEDLLEEQMAVHSSIPASKLHGQKSLAKYSSCSCKIVRHDLMTKQQQYGTIFTILL